MAHSEESHSRKDPLCCIFHLGDVGKEVAEHFERLLLQEFGRESEIELGWNDTICKDLPDTIIDNIKHYKFCLFIYSKGCDDKQFFSYWKLANNLMLTNKAKVIQLRVKPFSIDDLCEAITIIHNPIEFKEDFRADDRKWKRILDEMKAHDVHPEGRVSDKPRVASEVTDSVDSTTQQDLNAATSSMSNLSLKDTVYETVSEVLQALKENMRPPEGDDDTDNTMKVSRRDIWEGAKEAFTRTENKFKFNAPCIVTFAGEPAIDAGGPRAEAFTLLLRHIAGSTLFRGDEHSKMLNLDEGAVGDERYKLAGQIIAYALLHLGIRPCFCSPLLYSLIVDPKNSLAPCIDDIDDPELRAAVKKIDEAANQDYDSATESEWIENQIFTAGCTPLTMDFGKKSQLVKGLVKFDVITRTMEPLEQFTDGLRTLGVLDAVRAYPDLMKSAFVYTPDRLTADIMMDIFEQKVFSTIPGDRRKDEEKAEEHWIRFLKDPEVDADILSRLLIHVTCVDRIPGFGFNPKPLLGFTHRIDVRDDQELISISTCAHKLCIPCVENYDKFKSLLLQRIKGGQSFIEG